MKPVHAFTKINDFDKNGEKIEAATNIIENLAMYVHVIKNKKIENTLIKKEVKNGVINLKLSN